MGTKPEYCVTEDGSVVTADGRVAHFSIFRFKRDICGGECCFMCGVHPKNAIFNDEHVIPDWVLREFDLHSSCITLPNGNTYPYNRYKIRCCKDCNAKLGKHVELPVSIIVKGGLASVKEHLRSRGPQFLFMWLALLFLKTHLHDRSVRWHLDARNGAFPVSDAYDWEDLHHIHCLARTFFTKPHFNPQALGSFFALPACDDEACEHFDFGDLYLQQAIFFRFRDVAMVCILNDSCACMSLEKDRLFSRISGPLSPLQLREVMARVGYLNTLIKVHPLFHSEFSDGEYTISGIHPDVIDVRKWNPKEYGRVLHHACTGYLERCRNADIEMIKEHIRNGRYTFLFNEEGVFLEQQMLPLPETKA